MEYSYLNKISLKPEDLPMKLEVNTNSSGATFFTVLGSVLLVIGIGSFIFAPSELYYTGSLSLWQHIYMAPGPVTTVGAAMFYISSAFGSGIEKVIIQEADRYQLDPDSSFPEGAVLVPTKIEGQEGAYLDLFTESLEALNTTEIPEPSDASKTITLEHKATELEATLLSKGMNNYYKHYHLPELEAALVSNTAKSAEELELINLYIELSHHKANV